jgi:cytochrome c
MFRRKAGSAVGYMHYSESQKSAEFAWTDQYLFEYLSNPRKVVPGTKKFFSGLRSAQDIEDVIVYLKQATN